MEELVIAAMGGMEVVERIAGLPPLPKKPKQPDPLCDLARYLIKLRKT